MIAAFLLLIAFELVGELARDTLYLPIPGPVIGMFLLAAVLIVRKDRPNAPAIPEPLGRTAEGLIGHMGLLFVPAGVGIIAEAGLLRAEWLPILAGLVGSTILSLAVTGLVMHWTTRPRGDAASVALEAAPPDLVGHRGRAR
ncbi:CidA/LrgA family protein [Bradyrhizobium sp. USDA 10063]